MSLPENFWLTLQCDLSEWAPDGPGWYLYAARHDASGETVPLIPLRRLTKEQASTIGRAFDGVVHDGEESPVKPWQLMTSGHSLIQQALDAQIEEAEKVALKLARLRRLREAEREDDEESQPS